MATHQIPSDNHQITRNELSTTIDHSLNKLDFALQRVYNSQETLAAQLDQIEALLVEFNHINSPSIQIYIEKLLRVKDIIENLGGRVQNLNLRADNAKMLIRTKHQNLRPKEQSNDSS
jgi:hypothetical protein